jgi:plasmid stabilization system protein ParE
MKCKVEVLAAAKEDLKGIRAYLAQFGKEPPRKLREGFTRFVSLVSDNPRIFKKLECDGRYREGAVAFNYVAIYRASDDGSSAKVYRVLHSSRDIAKYLN